MSARRVVRARPAEREFVPNECIVDTRDPAANKGRHFGIEFLSSEKFAIWDAIADASGIPRRQVTFMLLDTAMRDFGKKFGVPYCYTYCDDAIVHLCNELGIDVKRFPHNTPKLPIAGFIPYARKRLVGFVLATNEIQWTVQRRKMDSLFSEWRATVCPSIDCDHDRHDCEERFERLSEWEIATQIAAVESDKAKLISSIDAKPKAKAVKAASDALARIAVSKVAQAAPERAAARRAP